MSSGNGKRQSLLFGPNGDRLPADMSRLVAISGTPTNQRGETEPDDYVSDMQDPVRRCEIFEEMRRSDGAVNTALGAREGLIASSNWMLARASDSPLDVEILEHCEDALYPLLDEKLRQLAGAVWFGFAALEPVVEWSDRPFRQNVARGKVRRTAKASGRKLYLKRLAHIRQRTISTFVIAGEGPNKGDLISADQNVYDRGRFKRIPIPAHKLVMWTYNKQGDDYWGVPPTRSAYKAYTFKNQIERLNLLGIDRFGVGTPVAIGGEGWTDAEFARLGTYLSAWRSGANTYLVAPYGGAIDIKGGSGELIGALLEWIKQYDLAIAKTYLTQGTELGSTETGARALGETFTDQSEGIVQGDNEAIASVINEQFIIPFVQWNYGPQEAYPTFQPSQRVRMTNIIGTLIQQLVSAKAVTWNPEVDEPWLRDALGLPGIDLDFLAAEAERKQQVADQIAGGGGPPEDASADDADAGDEDTDTPSSLKIAASHRSAPRVSLARRKGLRVCLQQLSAQEPRGVPDPAVKGTTYRTPEYSEWEVRTVKPDLLARDLDLSVTRLAAEVQDVLREIDASLVEQVVMLASSGAVGLANVTALACPNRLRTKLRDVLYTAAQRARDYGANAVLTEVARQLAPDAAAPVRANDLGFFARARRVVRQFVAGQEDDALRDLQLQMQVDRVAEDEIARREGSARGAAAAALATAGAAALSVLVSAAQARAAGALEELSPYRTESNVRSVVNVGFGVGRDDGADTIIERGATGDDAIVGKVYSAVLDFGTCGECEKWDGAFFGADYDSTQPGNTKAPNPRCAGGYDRCRCVWIWVTAREAPSLVGPTKGPASSPLIPVGA